MATVLAAPLRVTVLVPFVNVALALLVSQLPEAVIDEELAVKVPAAPTVKLVTVNVAAPVAVTVAVMVTAPDENVPVEMVIVPAAWVTEPPFTLKLCAPIAIVAMVLPVESNEAMLAPTSTVTVPVPELASKKTPLPAVGGLPCWGPPLVDAQCVPSDHEP